jgi:hypothetical protein
MTPIGCRVAAVTPRKRGEEHEFRPQRLADVGDDLGVDTGTFASREQRPPRRAAATARRCRNRKRAIVPVLRYDAGSEIFAAMYAAPPIHLRSADDGANALDAFDAVLEWNHDAACSEQRLDRGGGGLGVPQLDREKERRRTSPSSKGRR